MTKIFVIAFSLFAVLVEASTITSSIVSGQCVALSALPERMSWATNDPTGFVIFAAHDPTAGCAETIINPTSGVYSVGLNAGRYEALSLASWMPVCGRVQIDVQGYSATGLDPNALHTVLINTGIDCTSSSDTSGLGGDSSVFSSSTPTVFPPVTPIIFPPINTVPPTVPPVSPPVSVPDVTSTLVLLVCACVVLRMFTEQKARI